MLKSIFCLLGLFALSSGQYTGCDYFQQLQAGQKVNIFSPGYPNRNYGPGARCRWIAYSPPGTTIYLNCIDFNVPSSTNCDVEKLLVSLTGRQGLEDGFSFCGKGTFARFSTTNRISLALQTNGRAYGGKFLCELSVQSACSCGRRSQTRIVGGVESMVNEFTSNAGIINRDIEEIECGGTIISNQYILTAAHCLPNAVSRYAVVVGEHDYNSLTESPFTRRYDVTRKVIHPNYQAAQRKNDLGLLQTSIIITFNAGVGPCCLPIKFRGQTFAGLKVEAVGWGTLEFAGRRSSKLQKVTLDVVTTARCQANYSSVAFTEICTLTPGKDTCQYDSGGALYYTDSNSLLYNVGIVSYGTGCGSRYTPSVNIRVTEYLQWIRDNTPGATYCDV